MSKSPPSTTNSWTLFDGSSDSDAELFECLDLSSASDKEDYDDDETSDTNSELDPALFECLLDEDIAFAEAVLTPLPVTTVQSSKEDEDEEKKEAASDPLAMRIRAAMAEQMASEGVDGILYESHQVDAWSAAAASGETTVGANAMPVVVSPFEVPFVERSSSALDGERLRARLSSIGYGFITDIVSPHIVMAGGSLQQLADHEHNPDADHVRSLIKDVDLFPVDLTREELLRELARIGELLRNGVWKRCKVIYVFRTRNCITFRCRELTDGSMPQQPIIQVILRQHASLAHVLYGFDLGSCMIGWDGGDRVRFTPLGKLAREQRLNVVTFRAMRTSFHSRACKYHERGFSIALPSLCLKKILVAAAVAQTMKRACVPCLGFGKERLCLTGIVEGTTRIDVTSGRITSTIANKSVIEFLSPHVQRAKSVESKPESKEDQEDDDEDDEDDFVKDDEANEHPIHLQREPPSGKLFDYNSPSNMLRHNLSFLKRTLRRPDFDYRNGLAGMALYETGMDFTAVARYFDGLSVLLSRVCSPEHVDLVAVRRMLGRREGDALVRRMLGSASINRTDAARRYWHKIARQTMAGLVHTLGTTTERGKRYSSLPFAYEAVELDTSPMTDEAVATLDASWYHGWQRK